MVDSLSQEAFYKGLWKQHGSKEPDEDEKLRLEAIFKFIKKYVLTSFGGWNNIKMLDLGCGRGWLTNMLASFGNVIGIDPLEASVTKARELYPTLDFRIGTVADLLSNNSLGGFHLIIASEVIEHILEKDKKSFLKSIYSILTPDGFAILTTPRGELWNDFKRISSFGQPIEEWISEDKLDALAKEAGFCIVDRDRVFLPNLSYSRKSRLATLRPTHFLMKLFPRSKFFKNLRLQCAVYQTIILKKT